MSILTPGDLHAAHKDELTALPVPSLPRIKGEALVIPHNWKSPPVCAFTGRTEDLLPAMRFRAYWVRPWTILLLPLPFIGMNTRGGFQMFSAGLGIYLLVAWLTMRRASFDYYLSRAAAASRRKTRFIFGGSAIAGLIPLVAGVNAGSSVLILGGTALTILSVVFLLLLHRLFTVQWITPDAIWLGGVRPEVREKFARTDAEASCSATQYKQTCENHPGHL